MGPDPSASYASCVTLIVLDALNRGMRPALFGVDGTQQHRQPRVGIANHGAQRTLQHVDVYRVQIALRARFGRPSRPKPAR
jgi:hypothetical protein